MECRKPQEKQPIFVKNITVKSQQRDVHVGVALSEVMRFHTKNAIQAFLDKPSSQYKPRQYYNMAFTLFQILLNDKIVATETFYVWSIHIVFSDTQSLSFAAFVCYGQTQVPQPPPSTTPPPPPCTEGGIAECLTIGRGTIQTYAPANRSFGLVELPLDDPTALSTICR